MWFFEFSLWSLGALCKISWMLRFLKVYCSASIHPVSNKLYGKYGNREGMQAITFMCDLQILKVYGTLKRSYLSYIAIIHKIMLVSSGKRSSWIPRPLIPFFKIFDFQIFMIFFFFVFVSMGPYGSKNVKTLLLQFSSNLSQTLW